MIFTGAPGRGTAQAASVWLSAGVVAASVLAGCGSADPYQLGPPASEWSDEESGFVSSLRSTRPELTDSEAARWIVAGRAACQALREGYGDEVVSDRAGDVVDEEFTRVDISTSARSFCTEYVSTAQSFFEAS